MFQLRFTASVDIYDICFCAGKVHGYISKAWRKAQRDAMVNCFGSCRSRTTEITICIRSSSHKYLCNNNVDELHGSSSHLKRPSYAVVQCASTVSWAISSVEGPALSELHMFTDIAVN